MRKILGRVTSINVRKVLWAAAELGIDLEREDWGRPVRDPQVPEFLALNPNGLVPVLIEDGFVLWDSTAILRYLAGLMRNDLLPADGRERALVDQWMAWQATELNAAWSYAVRVKLRHLPNPDGHRIAESLADWTRMMRILERQLEGGHGFVANGRFSLADIVVGLSSHRWLETPFDKPRLPAVEDHRARMQARPAGKPWLGAATP
jgi:glutathione S-transferase